MDTIFCRQAERIFAINICAIIECIQLWVGRERERERKKHLPEIEHSICTLLRQRVWDWDLHFPNVYK